MIGQDDGQGTAGLGDDPGVPASGGGEFGGDAPGLLQGLAGDARCGPVGFVEVPGLAGAAQLQLRPAGGGGWLGKRGCPGRRRRAGMADAVHACERQLLITAGPEVGRGDPAPPCRGDTGLQPAQSAVPFLQRDDALAAGAFAAGVAAGEVVAGPGV